MSVKAEKRTARINIAGLARQHGPKAIQKLAEALDDSDPRVVLDAASKLLDRGYGRPTTTIERGENEPDKMTDAELIAAIREAALADVGEAGADEALAGAVVSGSTH